MDEFTVLAFSFFKESKDTNTNAWYGYQCRTGREDVMEFLTFARDELFGYCHRKGLTLSYERLDELLSQVGYLTTSSNPTYPS